MKYAIDSDVFIRAKREYYAFDFHSSFWDFLLAQHTAGNVWSVDRVKDELLSYQNAQDPLIQWSKAAPASFFASTQTAQCFQEYQQYQSWIQGNSQYTPVALADFGNSADGWLVAHAKINDLEVVTWEKPSNERNRVKIPDLATAHGVRTVELWDMLRDLGAQF